MKEITLKLNVDTYKALTNYIHNELHITKKDIEDTIERLVENIILKHFEKPNSYYSIRIDYFLLDSVRKYANSSDWQLEKRVRVLIERELETVITKQVKEQMARVHWQNGSKEG